MKGTGSMIGLFVLIHCLIGTGLVDAAVSLGTLELKSNVLLMKQDEYMLPVSLNCPQFNLDSWTVGGDVAISRPNTDICSGKVVELSFAPMALSDSAKLEVKLLLQWSDKESVLRKWTRFYLTGTESPMLLKEVILDNIKLSDGGTELSGVQAQIKSPQSYPIFLKGFFAGIEFPISSTRLEANSAIIAHRPGWRIEPGKWYQSRKAVYGIAPSGREKPMFQKYIMENSPGGIRRYFVWETWGSVPIAYTEADMMEQLELISDHLCKPYGVSLDAFVMTAGWSNNTSIWEMDTKRFPNGWTRIRKAVENMNCRMGMWISPSSNYDFALDNFWAKEQGYKTSPNRLPWQAEFEFLCLASERYQRRFKERVIDMFNRYDIEYAYFDGYWFECPEKDHSHEPGVLSAEATAEGLIDVWQSLRKKLPDVWLEATCFGGDGNGSPWWLFYVNTLLGCYGTDYPPGRIPSPNFRDGHTSARDSSNLQGQYYATSPIPLQDVFGGFFNNQEYKEYVMVNDMVMGVMRGNMLYMMAIDPKLMGDYQWAALAGIIKWARENVSIFAQTEPLLPESWLNCNYPVLGGNNNVFYEAYGYAHWTNDRGLVAMRNPWIVPQSYTIKLDSNELSIQAKNLSAVSIYPEPRVYAAHLNRMDNLTVKLAPYELLVLDIKKRQSLDGVPKADEQIGHHIEADVTKSELKRVHSEDVKKSQDKIQGKKTAAVEVKLQADVSISSPNAELLVLLDGDEHSPAEPEVRQLKVDGKKVSMVSYVSDEIYKAHHSAFSGHWRYIKAPLSPGKSRIDLKLISKDDCSRIGVWLWATKPSIADPRETVKGPITLPSPELLSLDSATLVELVETHILSSGRRTTSNAVYLQK